eukprot:TRINITY_DN4833_c0_g1_i3.p2 TRINITY_DN4833_c0_g1~~TRINITY_DN4833_c0_g1_i3.p2  ORF type:complete len:235 (-),score=117.61 TRINITY_DN4833_c0_g1_i3:976-1680(-)
MSPKDRKKALSKWRREQKKKEAKLAEQKKREAKKPKQQIKLRDYEKDPTGAEFVEKAGNLLEASVKLVRRLERYSPDRIETHLAAFDVAMKRNKVLQALRALKRAQKIDADHPELVTRVVQFFKQGMANENEELQDIVSSHVQDLAEDSASYIASFAERNGGKGLCVLALAVSDVDNRAKWLETLTTEFASLQDIKAKDAKKIVEDVKEVCGGDDELVGKIRDAALERFPMCVF